MRIGQHELEVVRIGGSADGPTIVLLHEGLGSVSTWRDLPTRLSEATGLPLVVYSRAGYGASDPVELPRPLTYMHGEAREVLPELLDELDLSDVVLFGHSDGASIALLYAATEHGRDRTRALVLEAPHVFCEDRSVRAIEEARDAYLDLDTGLRERLARHHANVDVAFWGWNGAWLDPRFRAWNIEDALPRVVAPALIVQSTDDPYGTAAQVTAIARAIAGHAELQLLEDCGHAPHRDHRDAVVQMTARFVAGALGRPLSRR